MRADILAKKTDVRFDVFDADGNGVLERSDYLDLARRLIESTGADPESPAARAVVKAQEDLWEVHVAGMDVNNDGVIDREEFRTAIERNVAAGPRFDEFFPPMAHAWIALADRSGSGALDLDAFVAIFRALNVDERASREAFSRIDTDHDGKIDESQYIDAWRDFYVSDDLSAPGNWLFGDLSR